MPPNPKGPRLARHSKAIPIVAPPNNDEDTFPPLPTPVTVQQKIDSITSASKHSSTAPIYAPTTPALTISDSESVSTTSREPEVHNEGDLDWDYDVYAHSFVPNTLKAINTVPAVIVDLPEYKQIDFESYVRSFTASAFWPPSKRVTGLHDDYQYSTKPPALAPEHYELYFKHYLQDELFALYKQCEANNLYAHPAVATWTGGTQSTIQIVVPGLREDDPLLFSGDLVYIRQLRLTPGTGLPVGMDNWLKSHEQGHAHAVYSYAPGFTGYQHNARVKNVLRNRETVILEVNNFLVESATDLRLNVVFPIQQRHFDSIAAILPPVQDDLKSESVMIKGRKLLSPDPDSTQSSPRRSRIATPSSDRNSLIRRQWIQSMLFPDRADGMQQTELNRPAFKHSTYDPLLNFEQLKAIHSVVGNDYGDVPYLISGPPGTGKTKTIVETALQLLETPHHGSILVCAPSDAAADTLVQRLAPSLDPEQLFRLNAPARTFAEVPSDILMYCFVLEDTFGIPSIKVLMDIDVVVTTCRDAAILCSARVSNKDLFNLHSTMRSILQPKQDKSETPIFKLHWTALLMDEAAQASEPEALVPLSVVAPPVTNSPTEFRPQFIMAGDEYQLGPRTASRSTGIRTSLFARISQRALYQYHPLARSKTRSAIPILTQNLLPITRPPFANLVRNYRSHPSILAIPSSLHYFDSLEPEATDTESLMSWEGWKGRKWPVLFVPTVSADEIERDRGGWYNIGEAKLACSYAKELVDSKLVEQKDICVMSPFSAQVKLLRKIIRENQMWAINIGPTEAFQGLESRVVIICTTRSKHRFIDHDISRSRGLVKQPQRTNVALTRAKHGLIVLGNREILREDPSWTAWMAFCDRNGLVDESVVTASGVPLDEGDWEESPEKTPPATRDGSNSPTRLERMLIMQQENNQPSQAGHTHTFGSSKDDIARSEEIWAAGIAAEQAILQQRRVPEPAEWKEINMDMTLQLEHH